MLPYSITRIPYGTASHCTPLEYAANKGCEEIVALLLTHGAHANTMNKAGSTPLHEIATQHGDVESGLNGVIKLLLAYGATINARDSHNNTALHAHKHFLQAGSSPFIGQQLHNFSITILYSIIQRGITILVNGPAISTMS